MLVKYIRDLVSMKAALASDEEAFKEKYPSGKYAYFEVEEADPPKMEAPKKKVSKKASNDD